MSRHPYLRNGKPRVLAHRGDSDQFPPGNTCQAFDAAIEAGVDHLETDVQVTSDGVVVIFHDERLDEITTGTGAVGDHPWSEIESLRYVVDGDPTEHRLVRFDEFLDRYPMAYINVDAKTDETVDPLLTLLIEHDRSDRTCVAAFGLRRIRRIRSILGEGWCTALSKPEIGLLRIASWLHLPLPPMGDVAQIPTDFRGITVADRRFLDAAHRSDIAVHVWTVNDLDEMQSLLRAGFDAVITDRPSLATAAIAAVTTSNDQDSAPPKT